VWKIGIVITTFTEDSLKFALYPITFDNNDVQIKFIDNKTYTEVAKLGYIFENHLYNNPLLNNPRSFALKSCITLFKGVSEKRKFLLPESEILDNELVFGIVDRYYFALGVDKVDCYSIDKLIYAYKNFLPNWIHEAVDYLIENRINGIKDRNDCLGRGALGKRFSYYDPIGLGTSIANKGIIDKKVREKLNISTNNIPILEIDHQKYPISFFLSTLYRLKNKNIDEVRRLFKKREINRDSIRPNYIYNQYSRENMIYNTKIIYESLPFIYDEFIKMNFPKQFESLKYFSDFNCVLIALELQDSYVDNQSPKIIFMYLNSVKNDDNFIRIAPMDKWNEIIKYDLQNSKYYFEEREYEVHSKTVSIYRTLSSGFPLLDTIYDTLETRMKNMVDNM
jgi:hypothetical protein